MLVGLDNPGEELTEEGKRRIGDDQVGLVTQGADFLATEVAVTLQILPLQVLDVDAAVARHVVVQNEDFAVCLALVGIVMGCRGLEQRGLVAEFVTLALGCITGGNEPLEAEDLEVLGEIFGKVAPLGVITRQEHRLATEHVGVVLKIGRDFLLNIMILSVELVILGLLSF